MTVRDASEGVPGVRGDVRGDAARCPLLRRRVPDVGVQAAPSFRQPGEHQRSDDPRPRAGDGHDQEHREVRSPAGEGCAGVPSAVLRRLAPARTGRQFSARTAHLVGPRRAIPSDGNRTSGKGGHSPSVTRRAGWDARRLRLPASVGSPKRKTEGGRRAALCSRRPLSRRGRCYAMQRTPPRATRRRRGEPSFLATQVVPSVT